MIAHLFSLKTRKQNSGCFLYEEEEIGIVHELVMKHYKMTMT